MNNVRVEVKRFFLEKFPHTLPNTESIARKAKSKWVQDKVAEMNGEFGKCQGNLGRRSHACPKLPIFSGCEVWPSSLMNKMLVRKFQRELPVETSAPFPSKKSALMLQRAHSRPHTGVGELKFHLITLKTAPISLVGMKTLVWLSMAVRGRTQTVPEKSDKGLFYLLIFSPLFPAITTWFCPQFYWFLGYFIFYDFFLE